MAEWPGPHQLAVYEPLRTAAIEESVDALRARIAAARFRDGLAVSEEIAHWGSEP
jgi:hypothetical protein